MRLFDALGKDAAIERTLRYVGSLEAAPVWNDWYVGITRDVSRKLYAERRAPSMRSIYVSVDSAATARDVEKYLIDCHGLDGRPGGAEYPRYVYAFKKLPDTDPPLCSRQEAGPRAPVCDRHRRWPPTADGCVIADYIWHGRRLI